MATERDRLLKLVDAQKKLQDAAREASKKLAEEESKRKTGQKA